jgi:hypothetical protein
MVVYIGLAIVILWGVYTGIDLMKLLTLESANALV